MFGRFFTGEGSDCTRSAFVDLAWQAGVVEKHDGFLVTITAREKLESDAATGANEVIEFVGNDNEGCTVGNYTALPVNSRLIPMIETDK